MNFRAVLALPKTAGSAQTHKSMSFIWIVWSTLYVYLWRTGEFAFWLKAINNTLQNLKGAYSGLPEANIVVHICMPVDAIFQFPVQVYVWHQNGHYICSLN